MSNTNNPQDHKHKHDRRYSVIAIGALILALIALLLRSCSPFESAKPSPTSTICPSATPTPGSSGNTGAQGEPGLSAYDLWTAMGNSGTIEDFLKSLIGTPGKPGADGAVIYYGSNGLTGATGQSGKSAYQLWLDSGKTGTENDFLASLIGPTGSAGPAGAAGSPGAHGLSAYQVWLAIGNSGSETDFFNSLAGVPGSAGADGLSAYQIWINNGHVGTEGQFLASLVGPQGIPGAPGVCTIGDTGASAYEVWLAAGNVGTEQVFLASLVGAKGDTGPQGPAGPPGSGGLGYYGSFYDTTVQTLATPGTPQAWRFNHITGASNGVTIESNGAGSTRIKFPVAGMYNIAFSTVFSKSNSNSDYVDIWFAENGNAIADSNTRVTVAGQAQTVAAWNFFYNCTNNSNYVEIMWYTPSSTISVDAISGLTSPTRPNIPSIIMTVNQVGGTASQ